MSSIAYKMFEWIRTAAAKGTFNRQTVCSRLHFSKPNGENFHTSVLLIPYGRDVRFCWSILRTIPDSHPTNVRYHASDSRPKNSEILSFYETAPVTVNARFYSVIKLVWIWAGGLATPHRTSEMAAVQCRIPQCNAGSLIIML